MIIYDPMTYHPLSWKNDSGAQFAQLWAPVCMKGALAWSSLGHRPCQDAIATPCACRHFLRPTGKSGQPYCNVKHATALHECTDTHMYMKYITHDYSINIDVSISIYDTSAKMHMHEHLQPHSLNLAYLCHGADLCVCGSWFHTQSVLISVKVQLVEVTTWNHVGQYSNPKKDLQVGHLQIMGSKHPGNTFVVRFRALFFPVRRPIFQWVQWC